MNTQIYIALHQGRIQVLVNIFIKCSLNLTSSVYVDLLIRKPSTLTNVLAADSNGLRRRRFYSISPDSISPVGNVKPSGSDLDNVKHNPDSPSPLQSSLSPAALDLSQELSEMKNKLASQERKDVIYPDNLNIREANTF